MKIGGVLVEGGGGGSAGAGREGNKSGQNILYMCEIFKGKLF